MKRKPTGNWKSLPDPSQPLSPSFVYVVQKKEGCVVVFCHFCLRMISTAAAATTITTTTPMAMYVVAVEVPLVDG